MKNSDNGITKSQTPLFQLDDSGFKIFKRIRLRSPKGGAAKQHFGKRLVDNEKMIRGRKRIGGEHAF